MGVASRLLAVVVGWCALAASGHAQSWPDHPVKVIVPFAAGGPTDVTARLIAQKLSERLKQQFYVENHAGAGGNVGIGAAAKSAGDGYTILFASSSFVVNPSLYAQVPYDPFRDFAPVTMAVDSPNAILVNPAVPARDANELVALIRANPGKYNFATAGVGTTPHLAGEVFKRSLGLDLVHVPFAGAGPAVQSAVAGHTPIIFTTVSGTVPLVRESKLRALAVMSRARASALPEVATTSEQGLAGLESNTFQGVLVPAGTPQAVIERLHAEITQIEQADDARQRFAALGFELVANTPAQFSQMIRDDITKWGKVIREANIHVE
jgi:tripartite-type tricarboxylate transporter receptor subunit TctC